MTPFWAMWTADLAFLGLGLALAARMSRTAGTNRGGAVGDVLFNLFELGASDGHPLSQGMIRILDRLIAGTFLRIFALFILGAPLLFVVGDLVEYVDRYFERGLSVGEVATAYVYMLPEFISWSFPIAALIAVVFTIHSMTQHREVLAAKAGGISFHRLMAPLVVLGLALTGAGLLLSEVVPVAKRRSGQILRSEEIGRQWAGRLRVQDRRRPDVDGQKTQRLPTKADPGGARGSCRT